MPRLNLAFHKICHQPQNEWEVKPLDFRKIVNWCTVNYPNFHIYFDDGDTLDCLEQYLFEIRNKVTFAIVIDKIGKAGFFGWKKLEKMKSQGFHIASHGVNHTSLCWFDNFGNKSTNPKKGDYTNSQRGKTLLSVNQVRYQIIESFNAFSNHRIHTNEFVFPYGLYSDQTIKILDQIEIYKKYVTCDPSLDFGKKIVPRLLINNQEDNIGKIRCLIKNTT